MKEVFLLRKTQRIEGKYELLIKDVSIPNESIVHSFVILSTYISS